MINPELAPEAAELAHQIRNEFVLRAEGTLVARSPETVNPNMPTGEVELQVDKLEIVSRSTPLPFQLDEENVDETLRLRYRWLDLRREKLQRNITLRAQMVGIIRREMEAAGFLDIQTPILFKPTPEGARDFVVPSRLQKGRFYALPQSPQILKQLTMVAGFDRYYQIAICFRDEDLRADRVQEITQLDVEMSFPDQEFLYDVMERMYARIWRECLGIEIATPFPRMTFEEADRRFGSDKPDTRFGLELEDATEVTRNSEFGVFKGAEAVRFLRVPQELSRGDLAKLEELAKEWGAKGLAYLVFDEEGEVRSPIAKFLSEEELAVFRGEPGVDRALRGRHVGRRPRACSVRCGCHLGRELGLIDDDVFTFLWVYDFPMFERDEENGPLDGGPPPVHAADEGVGGTFRRGPRARARARVRPDRQRQRARRRQLQDPRARDPGTGFRAARHVRGGAAVEVRLPARRARDGCAADGRHRARDRPDDDGPRRRAQPARRDRLPEEPGRGRSDERRAVRGDAGAAARTWNKAA